VTVQRWRQLLLGIHLISAGGWIIAAVAESMLIFHGRSMDAVGRLRAAEFSLFLDDELLVPCAVVVTYSGIMLATLMPWGLRRTWVTVKLVGTIVGLIFGTVWLGGWLDEVVNAAQNGDSGPVWAEMIGGWVLVAGLAVIGWIGITKPWAKRAGTGTERRSWVWAIAVASPVFDVAFGLYGILMLAVLIGYGLLRMWDEQCARAE
jgi:hypothetical protein